MKLFPGKRLLWLVLVLALIVALAGGFLLGSRLSALAVKPVAATTTQHDSQVITAVTRTGQVSLLSLSVQGITQKTTTATIFGMPVPGSDRALFLQYNFTAKLGLDGTIVTIEPTGDKQFTITIPQFMFIGHDNVTFQLAAEHNGVLSFTTPNIDTTDMVNDILSPDAQQRYVIDNDATLRDQARSFYSGIVSAVDPTVVLQFKFGTGQ